jgi:hypothetical protein
LLSRPIAARRSLKINREMNVAISHPQAVRWLVEELFEPFPERWSDHLVEMLGDYIF